MVTTGPAGRLVQRLLGAVRRDWAGLAAAVRVRLPVRPGLRCYRVDPPGGTRQIHLRIQRDGSGVLWIDVADVIHLNPTAAALAKLALDGVPAERAVAISGARFHRAKHVGNVLHDKHVEDGLHGAHVGNVRHDTPVENVRHDAVANDVQAIYRLVDHLRTTTAACPTCGLEDLARTPLFGTPIHAPYKADLALSYGCNNACRHCYNPRERVAMPSLGPRQWRRVLRRLARIGIPHVIFTGGEPTLCDDLSELIREGSRLGLVTGVNTNGRRLADRHFADSLARAGLSHVQVTLESHRAGVHNAMTAADSFDETVRGIGNARAAGLYTITNTTLTRRNVDHAEALVDFLHRLGLDTFACNGMIHSGCGQGNADAVPEDALAGVLRGVRDRAAELGMRFLWYTPTEYCCLSPVELELGPRRCNAGEYSICIEPDGSVLPCQSYYTPVGHILRDPWPAIWNSPLFQSFRNRSVDPAGCGLPEMCRECPDLPLCGGGCRIERESRTVVTGFCV